MEPGFVTSLKQALKRWQPLVDELNSRPGGLSDTQLISLVSRPTESIAAFEFAGDCDVVKLTSNWTKGSLDGVDALRNQRVSFMILTGDDALLQFSSGMSLLGFKLAQAHDLFTTLMIDPAHTQSISEHIAGITSIAQVGGVEQFQSFRLTPDNGLSFDRGSWPEMYPTGTGDLPAAMAEGATAKLKELGIKYVVINSVNNLGLPCNVEALTLHINSGKPVTCQVVRRVKGDTDGTLIWKDGVLQAAEPFELDDDLESATWCNTGTYIINIDTLLEAGDKLNHYHRVRKTVGTRLVVQYERFIKELTEIFPTNFVEVDRETYYDPIRSSVDLQHAEQRYFDPEA